MMRNNALQNKHLSMNRLAGGYDDFDDDDDDTVALVRDKQKFRKKSAETSVMIQKPAFVEWAERLNEIQFELEHISEKMLDLNDLHDKHLKRPTLSDNTDDEIAVEAITREITQIFMRCKNTMKMMDRGKTRLNEQEQLLAQNMLSGTAINLQNMSMDFRQAQTGYLKKLKSREERSHQFFIDADPDLMIGQTYEGDIDDVSFERGLTREQMQLVDDNSKMVETRESEIQSVVKSITELSEIFQDLGNIIVEQSSIIDRIDYNIENTVQQTETGLKELKKAEEYQKKNKKMLIIVVLSVILIIMLFGLLIKHSWP